MDSIRKTGYTSAEHFFEVILPMLRAKNRDVATIDLQFLGMPGAIATYLIPHNQGAVLVESGPGSTLPTLITGINAHGFTAAEITDVILTHIHLDHAGAAGWLARQGARIHVHPNGAPHLLNPEKLLASAARIYDDQMDRLWGEFLPVPEDRLFVHADNEVILIEGLEFLPLDTPGHANHHYAYLYEDVCFSGDIGGVRLQQTKHLRLPMPPPELNLEEWRNSLSRISQHSFKRIAPTHFGLFSDPEWHLAALSKALTEVDDWISAQMPLNPTVEELNQKLTAWAYQRALADDVSEDRLQAYESANPTWMSGYGIHRYWRKHRLQPEHNPGN
jgi:glyoxylase-like metal-dependent hydrolase (beta-lactamase superfamily II)